MAFINCPGCGKQISDLANMCVHCGYQLKEPPQEAAAAPEEATDYSEPAVASSEAPTSPKKVLSPAEKKKRLIIIGAVAAVMVIVIVIFCSTTNNDKTVGEPTTTQTEQMSSRDVGYTIEKVKAQSSEKVFIKRNDMFYPISSYKLLYGAGTIHNLEYQGFSENDLSSVPNISLEKGDQLVTFENVSEYRFYPVTGSWNAYPVAIKIDPIMTKNGAWYTIYDYGNISAPRRIDELEGQSNFYTVDEVINLLSSKNVKLFDYSGFETWFIYSNQPVTLNAGFYYDDSAEYHETTIQLDYHYVQYGDRIAFPTIRSNEGYFTIDLSSIDSGLYVIDVGKNWPSKYILSVSNQR